MEEVTEDIKRELLELISNVEASLPLVREAIENREISTSYRGTFWTKPIELPNGVWIRPVELRKNKVTFSFPGAT